MRKIKWEGRGQKQLRPILRHDSIISTELTGKGKPRHTADWTENVTRNLQNTTQGCSDTHSILKQVTTFLPHRIHLQLLYAFTSRTVSFLPCKVANFSPNKLTP